MVDNRLIQKLLDKKLEVEFTDYLISKWLRTQPTKEDMQQTLMILQSCLLTKKGIEDFAIMLESALHIDDLSKELKEFLKMN